MHLRTTARRHGRRNHHHEGRGHFRHLFAHGRGGRSVRRGNVRYAILNVLADGPMHGYQIISEWESRTQGRWRPSAGSVYPTLQLLEDEGLVSADTVDGRKTYSLTDAGRQAAEDHPIKLDIEAGNGRGSHGDLRRLTMGLIGAAREVQRTGSPEMRAAATEILVDARKRLYRLLADDEAGESASPEVKAAR